MTGTVDRSVIEHEIGPDGAFHVRIHAGDLSLRGVAGTLVRVRELDGRDLSERFDTETSSGSLTIRPQAALGEVGILLGGRRSSRVDVELPAGTTVVVETVSADVAATGLTGEQRYRTTSGDVRIRASHGAIVVETVSGDLALDGDAALDLMARVISGSVAVAAPEITRLTVTTTSGDVQLGGSLVGSGPFAVRTVSGDARLTLAGDVRIEGRSLTGRVHSDRPHQMHGRPGRRNVVVDGQGSLLTFESVSGGLRITEPRTAAGTEPAPSSSQPPAVDVVAVDEHEVDRLEILWALERGEIDVAQATAKLAELDPDEPGTAPTDEGVRA
jgi:putative adhesin